MMSLEITLQLVIHSFSLVVPVRGWLKVMPKMKLEIGMKLSPAKGNRQQLQDGLSWNTFTASYIGLLVLPLTNSHFHTTTQLRFTFIDAVDSDIGY